jgi:hypothetical protein
MRKTTLPTVYFSAISDSRKEISSPRKGTRFAAFLFRADQLSLTCA